MQELALDMVLRECSNAHFGCALKRRSQDGCRGSGPPFLHSGRVSDGVGKEGEPQVVSLPALCLESLMTWRPAGDSPLDRLLL